MDQSKTEPDFTVEGQEELKTLLDTLLHKSREDREFAATPHYILFQLNTLESLIKVDMSQSPYQFWHYNLQERAALASVKEAIVNFLQKECGVDDAAKSFHDLYDKVKKAKLAASLSGEVLPLPENPKQHGMALLEQERRSLGDVLTVPVTKEPATSGWFSFFTRKPDKVKQTPEFDQDNKQTPKNNRNR